MLLNRINAASRSLQSSTGLISTMVSLYGSNFIKNIRNNFKEIENQAENIIPIKYKKNAD